MQGASPPQLTASLYVMNSANNLYLRLTTDDDEFSTVGEFLSKGDDFRIDFDNDHGGTLFSLGDELLNSNAGLPQFGDLYIYDPVPASSDDDVDNGGTTDGNSIASRVNNKNHFEIEHPGFRLEYLDAEANGDFGGSYRFPGTSNTSQADIVIADCTFDSYIPIIMK